MKRKSRRDSFNIVAQAVNYFFAWSWLYWQVSLRVQSVMPGQAWA